MNFFLFVVRFLGHFCTDLVTDKDYIWHQNDDREFSWYVTHVRIHIMSLVIPILVRGVEEGGGGGFMEFPEGGGVKKRESPDFRSPEVSISALPEEFHNF